MSDIIIVADDVQEGSDAYNVGAIVGGDGRTLLVHSDITGPVTLEIFERRTMASIYSTTFSAGSTGPLYDVPFTGPFWGLDNIGGNWKHHVTVADLDAQSAVQRGGRTYLHIYSFPTANDGTVRAIFQWTIKALPDSP